MSNEKFKYVSDQRGFSQIYHDSLESGILETAYEISLFVVLKHYIQEGGDGTCFPSVSTLARLSGMGTTKVRETLKSLRNKGIIEWEERLKEDGSHNSNMYTLYDVAAMWSSKNVTEITKAKEEAAKKTDVINEEKTEKYSFEEVRIFYDYDVMIENNSNMQEEIDSVISILYSILNSNEKTQKIGRDQIPTAVVIGKLMKLNYSNIIYAIEKYNEQTGRIEKGIPYMTKILYKAKEQMNLDINNQVAHDMATIDFQALKNVSSQ